MKELMALLLVITLGCFNETERKIDSSLVDHIGVRMLYPHYQSSSISNYLITDSSEINQICYLLDEYSVENFIEANQTKGVSFNINFYLKNGSKKFFRLFHNSRKDKNIFEIEIMGDFESTGFYKRYYNDSLGLYLNNMFNVDSLTNLFPVGSGLPCNK